MENCHEDNKWNVGPAFVHLPVSNSFPSYWEVPRLKSGQKTWALHSFHTKGQGNKRRPCQWEGTQAKHKSAWGTGQTWLFSPLCPPTTSSNRPSLNPDLWQGREKGTSTNKYVTLDWGGTIHWLNMKAIKVRPTPAQEGCQAHTNIYVSWAEISLMFCSPNERRILSTGPGIWATAIWDIQNSKNLFPSVPSCLG